MGMAASLIYHEVAESLLDSRYYLKQKTTGYSESSWEQVCRRVARVVASAETLHDTDVERIHDTENMFYDMLYKKYFIPNSPTLFNAGINQPAALLNKCVEDMTLDDYRSLFHNKDRQQQLSACFAGSVEDSLEDIMDVAKSLALIIKSGGGFGVNLSKLRPQNATIHGTLGKSSGPLSFLQIYNTIMSVVEAGYRRRGAGMALLSVTHPDVFNFIKAKDKNNGESVLSYFNLSVAFPHSLDSREIAKKIENGQRATVFTNKFIGYPPAEGEAILTIDLNEVLDKIAESAWRSGDPGMLFFNKMNEINPMYPHDIIASCNPCGEQHLWDWTSCNLGSINLWQIYEDSAETAFGLLNSDLFIDMIHRATHFLDNVIDVNSYPLNIIETKTKLYRPIGLGILGFADVLLADGIKYGNNESLTLAAAIAEVLEYESSTASVQLAVLRDSFPAFVKSRYYTEESFHPKHAKYGSVYTDKQWQELIDSEHKGKRNVLTTTIAPTGSTHILAGASYGIEPYFDVVYDRKYKAKDGSWKTVTLVAPGFEKYMRKHGFKLEEAIDYYKKFKDYGLDSYEIMGPVVGAMDVPPEAHLMIADAMQAFISNSISKTVQLPNSATVSDVKNLYLKAMKINVHGITVYRDGSLDTQVLNKEKKETKVEFTISAKPEKKLISSDHKAETCPVCGEQSLRRTDGCIMCSNCGYSACV